MTSKKFLKAFLAGVAFPATFMPIAYTLLYFFGPYGVLKSHSLQFIPMYLPIAWGIANVIYSQLSDGLSIQKNNAALWLTGIILGFLIAVLGVFIFQIPALVLGLRHGFEYLPLVLMPFIYGLIFRFIVKRINKTIAV